MAGEFSPTNGVTKAALDTAKFVPEIWVDEIVATYKKALVMANLVKKMSVVGKKGDAVNIPAFTRGAASAKASLAQVTLQAHSGTGIQVALDQHWEYARLIEDIAKVQSNNPMRGVYTEDAGYALAKVVDDYLHDLTSSWQGGAGTAAWDKLSSVRTARRSTRAPTRRRSPTWRSARSSRPWTTRMSRWRTASW